MPSGRGYAVRSHRRRSRRRVLPWVIVPLALALIGSGLTFGYTWLKEQGCEGSVSANIVAPQGTAALLRTLALQWEQTKPKVDGTCASVTIRDQEASVTAQALTLPWDPSTAGPAPDVWVPQSSAWARSAAAKTDTADRLMPDKLPSVARTPVVIAMPKTLAEAYGWPQSQLDWKDLLDRLAADTSVKLGMSDPATSTAGLLALSSIIDANDDADVDTDEFKRVFGLEQRITVYRESTEELFAEYISGRGDTLNAFPALEQDVVKHNEANPNLALVAVYPNNATTEADHPFLSLAGAPWKDDKRQEAAAAFLDFIKSDDGRRTVLNEGFRDSNRAAGPQLTTAKGVVAKLTALPRAMLLADAITKTVNAWNALTRPANVLLVLDVSGSMGGVVPGTGKSKMDLTKEAATEAVGMFDKESQVGLWVFSSNQSGNNPYREIVKSGKLDEQVNGVERRKRLTDELADINEGGNTGMYDTIWAAHQFVATNYQANAENLVVLLTDGADDDQLQGLKLEELVSRLGGADKSKPVKVVTIALGRDTNSDALTAISEATGVRPYSSLRSFDIQKVMLDAIFEVK